MTKESSLSNLTWLADGWKLGGVFLANQVVECDGQWFVCVTSHHAADETVHRPSASGDDNTRRLGILWWRRMLSPSREKHCPATASERGQLVRNGSVTGVDAGTDVFVAFADTIDSSLFHSAPAVTATSSNGYVNILAVTSDGFTFRVQLSVAPTTNVMCDVSWIAVGSVTCPRLSVLSTTGTVPCVLAGARRTVTVQLVGENQRPFSDGGALVHLFAVDANRKSVAFSPTVDNGNGTYQATFACEVPGELTVRASVAVNGRRSADVFLVQTLALTIVTAKSVATSICLSKTTAPVTNSCGVRAGRSPWYYTYDFLVRAMTRETCLPVAGARLHLTQLSTGGGQVTIDEIDDMHDGRYSVRCTGIATGLLQLAVDVTEDHNSPKSSPMSIYVTEGSEEEGVLSPSATLSRFELSTNEISQQQYRLVSGLLLSLVDSSGRPMPNRARDIQVFAPAQAAEDEVAIRKAGQAACYAQPCSESSTITDNGDGSYGLLFCPRFAGPTTLTVVVLGRTLIAQQVAFDVVGPSVELSSMRVSASYSQTTRPICIEITVRDSAGRPMPNAPVQLIDVHDGQTFRVQDEIISRRDGSYVCMYASAAPGIHSVQAQIGSKPLLQSPISFDIRAPTVPAPPSIGQPFTLQPSVAAVPILRARTAAPGDDDGGYSILAYLVRSVPPSKDAYVVVSPSIATFTKPCTGDDQSQMMIEASGHEVQESVVTPSACVAIFDALADGVVYSFTAVAITKFGRSAMSSSVSSFRCARNSALNQ